MKNFLVNLNGYEPVTICLLDQVFFILLHLDYFIKFRLTKILFFEIECFIIYPFLLDLKMNMRVKINKILPLKEAGSKAKGEPFTIANEQYVLSPYKI